MTNTVLVGGDVIPCDGVCWQAEAVAIGGNRIMGVGSRSDMISLAGPGAKIIDLKGATVLPGLIDTHPHVMHFGAMASLVVDLTDATSHDDIIARIRAKAETTPPGEWIMTTPIGEPHYFIRRSYRDLKEGRMPDRHVLDQATQDHPVLIQPWAPKTPNICAFNTMGLQRVGLSRITPERVANTWIDRDRDGELTGILRGSVANYYTLDPFWLQIWSKLPPLPDNVWEMGARYGIPIAHAMGVTAIYEGHSMEVDNIRAYQKLRQENQLNIRVQTSLELANQPFRPHYHPTMDEIRETLDLGRSLTSVDDDWLRIHGVTCSRSGPCFPGFLNTYEPFVGPYGEECHGVIFMPQEVETIAIDYCLKHNVRFNTVLGSLRDHDEFFESIEPFAREHDIAARKWIMQHCIMIAEPHIRRAAELGFGLTTSVGFAWGKGAMYGERLGQHIWRDLVPLKRLIDLGVTVGAGTDWGPKNIFEQMKLAQTHEFAGSHYCNNQSGQVVSRTEALLMWTRDAAKVMDWQGIGSIQPGNFADLTIVDHNPLTVDLDTLPNTQVLQTIIDGRVVYGGSSL